MTKTTHPITYTYEFNHDESLYTFEITRRHLSTAYARNGNVGNPTEYFTWEVRIFGPFLGEDGQRLPGFGYPTRTVAYEYARAHILGIDYHHDDGTTNYRNVRQWNVVENEMRANYKGRKQEEKV